MDQIRRHDRYERIDDRCFVPSKLDLLVRQVQNSRPELQVCSLFGEEVHCSHDQVAEINHVDTYEDENRDFLFEVTVSIETEPC